MEHDTKHPLVPRPGTDITTPGRRTSRVMEVVTGDILARARAQDHGAARFPIGDYLLREPDYRQILRWAEAAGLAPQEVLERLAESAVEHVTGDRWGEDWLPIGFSVEDGAIISVAWDFDRLPFISDNWELGLLIRTLGFKDEWPDVATALCPVLPRLQALWCRQLRLEVLDLSPVPGLTKLCCHDNNLSELDLSPVPGLTMLRCGENNLSELDLSPVPGLTKLWCWNNNLSELDLSPVPGLTELRCAKNNLSELDLSPVPGLTELRCDENVCVLNARPGLVINGVVVEENTDDDLPPFDDDVFPF